MRQEIRIVKKVMQYFAAPSKYIFIMLSQCVKLIYH
jgi:hypothetical protein